MSTGIFSSTRDGKITQCIPFFVCVMYFFSFFFLLFIFNHCSLNAAFFLTGVLFVAVFNFNCAMKMCALNLPSLISGLVQK